MVRHQASKKTDFTVDLTWWGSLRLAPIIVQSADYKAMHCTGILGLVHIILLMSYIKAMQSLATNKQTFKFNILYKTYIRQHIEYYIQAWSPYYAKDIDLLEKVQHQATKLLPQLANLPYLRRIRNLDIYSLYCRRQRRDLIETFKIMYRLASYFYKKLPCHQSILKEV